MLLHTSSFHFALGVVLGWAAVVPALGQEQYVTWHESYKDAIEEARSTGKPIFLEFRCAP